MRRQVGKGIWIRDYKKGTKEEKIGVDSDSSENSMELLKKEIKYVDNLQTLKNPKTKKLREKYATTSTDEVTFLASNVTETYNSHIREETMLPVQSMFKQQKLLVYKHRQNEYLTVDVEVINTRMLFLPLANSSATS